DKIVLVGAWTVGIADVVATPFDPVLPGIELHANVIDNVLHQRYLLRNHLTQFVDFGLICLFGLGFGFVLSQMNAARSIFYTTFVLIGFTAFNYGAFVQLRWLLSYVYPGLTLVVTSAALISYKYFAEEREKKRTR